MQTEYCIDTTAKAGFEHGYNIIIADGGHTTFENSVLSAEQMYVHYNKIIFNDSFSKVLTLNQIQAFLDQR
jgi:nicotinamidase-related amidase